MHPDRWQHVKQIFDAALQLPEDQRQRYLDSSCGADAELRAEVESLLRSDQEAGGFLQSSPPHDPVPVNDNHAPDPLIGTVAGVYKIIERIGHGGMGVVYRASDQRLGRNVALKFLSEDLRQNNQARDRFQREARSASALNHPNICTVYGVDEINGRPYIAMELLQGQTLSQVIGGNALESRQLLDIAIPISEALETAHAAGIIHRDIKPANILLTDKGQVKVLDFGLAKQTGWALGEEDTVHTLLTSPGTAMGTVTYMSPEQARGEPLDARTDMFSFGSVLYEMATGQRAFPGKTPILICDAILNRIPTPISELNPAANVEIETIINRALEKNRELRYQSAAELRADLVSVREEIGSGSSRTAIKRKPSETKRSTWKLAASLGLALVLLLALASFWRELRREHANSTTTGSAQSQVLARPSVAVLGFRNLTGRPEQNWLSTAFAEMISTELAVGGRLRVIPGENVARAKADLALDEAISYSPETLKRIRKNLGADYVVVGSYIDTGKEAGGNVRLDVVVQNAVGGETVASIPETGTEEKLIDLLANAGFDLRARLGVGEVAGTETAKAAASLPKNRQAAQLYSEGLAKLRQFDPVGARDALLKAAAGEPQHPLIHAALAIAWGQLGYDSKKQEEARQAASLSTGLPQSDQLWVEGLFREATHEWSKAIDVYRTLLGIYPDNIEYGLRLADAQTNAGLQKDALQTIATLRKLPPPANDDPRIDLAEADADEVSGAFQNEKQVATRALEEARARDMRLLGARALYSRAWAALNMGEMSDAAKDVEEARAIYVAARDRNGEANLVRLLGTVHLMQGDLARAVGFYEDALRIAREVGNRYSEAAALNQTATALDRQGDRTGALARYQEAMAILHAIGNKLAEGTALNNIANILWARGDLAGARKMYDRALAVANELGDRSRAAGTTINIAHILYQQGDLGGAQEWVQRAIPIAQEIGQQTVIAEADRSLGDLRLARGDLAGARQHYEDSLALRIKLGEQGSIAETGMSLAELALAEGHADLAQKGVQTALEEFRKEGLRDLEIAADGLLARALIEQGKNAEAKKALDAARPILAKNENPYFELGFLIDEAKVQAANGQSAAAKTKLESALRRAANFGFVDVQFQLRLALGEIELHSGDVATGRARLATLEKDAAAKGFLFVARKAASTAPN